MNSKFGKAMNSTEYAANWQATAVSNDASGAYTWMAGKALQPKRVIEIGCGSGQSTASLLAVGARILAIEENKPMIDRAVKHLKQFCVVEKLTLADMENFDWHTGAPVKILHADVFSPALPISLPKQVDAVVCWQIGVRPEAIAAHLQVPLESFKGHEMSRYREDLQKRVFALGAAVLAPGGSVHVVDRVGLNREYEAEKVATEIARFMQNIAGSNFDVSPSDVHSTKLEPNTFKASSIQYYGPAPGAESLIFTSTLARKN